RTLVLNGPLCLERKEECPDCCPLVPRRTICKVRRLSMSPVQRITRQLCLILTPLVLIATVMVGYAPVPAGASSHREAPLISTDPEADGTDFYMFVAPNANDSVTFVASYYPGQLPDGGPNYYHFGDDVLYEIKIDNVGDGKAHIKYQFDFSTTYVKTD